MALQLKHPDLFSNRHLGPTNADISEMLKTVKADSLDHLIDATVPPAIRFKKALNLPAARGEREMLDLLWDIAQKNQAYKSFIGAGYSDCITPPVIQRNILENPGWYTAYTPYQAEIAQGRLEALLNYQTMVMDLTGLEIANASLLDEGTAAAEAMHMAYAIKHKAGETDAAAFFVAADCHPQTIDVVKTRARPLNIKVLVGDPRSFDFAGQKVFGALLQYPATDGAVMDHSDVIEKARKADALTILAADLLALALLKSPGELGADVAIGSTQRFGIPMGFGGPHAAYFATRQAHARLMPGRLIGVSEDAQGHRALRMALQTREQHIRREKATSNICTAQVLLAVMSGMYAVYHGPKGIKAIAQRVHNLTAVLGAGLSKLGAKPRHSAFFDTVRVELTAEKVKEVLAAANARHINLRRLDERTLCVALDEVTSAQDVEALWACFNGGKPAAFSAEELAKTTEVALPPSRAHLRLPRLS